mmetsp:Transcript_34087/g.119162  ORF Transcript_34087/g.119162 Transcript_34087/m.119162 type:complete len:452 (+) Transcript_34087:2152-3507(+)
MLFRKFLAADDVRLVLLVDSNLGAVVPRAEALQERQARAVIVAEGGYDLHAVDDADALDARAVVAAEEQRQRNKLGPRDLELALDVCGVVRLDELLLVENILVHLFRPEHKGVRVVRHDAVAQAREFQRRALRLGLHGRDDVGHAETVEERHDVVAHLVGDVGRVTVFSVHLPTQLRGLVVQAPRGGLVDRRVAGLAVAVLVDVGAVVSHAVEIAVGAAGVRSVFLRQRLAHHVDEVAEDLCLAVVGGRGGCGLQALQVRATSHALEGELELCVKVGADVVEALARGDSAVCVEVRLLPRVDGRRDVAPDRRLAGVGAVAGRRVKRSQVRRARVVEREAELGVKVGAGVVEALLPRSRAVLLERGVVLAVVSVVSAVVRAVAAIIAAIVAATVAAVVVVVGAARARRGRLGRAALLRRGLRGVVVVVFVSGAARFGRLGRAAPCLPRGVVV